MQMGQTSSLVHLYAVYLLKVFYVPSSIHHGLMVDEVVRGDVDLIILRCAWILMYLGVTEPCLGQEHTEQYRNGNNTSKSITVMKN